MRAFVAWATYPILLGGGMALGVVALARGGSAPLVLGVLGVVAMMVVALLERLHPFVSRWNEPRGDVGADVLHLLVSNTGVSQLVNVGVLAAITAVAPVLVDAVGSPLWPTRWPLAAEVALALLVAELGVYWMHRLLHERPRLWPLHVVHHSPDRLYWLNGFRNHPFDAALQYGASMIPLVLLGASPDAITLVALLGALHTPLQHSNIALATGPLCRVLGVAELHRWHHAPGAAANVNYGAVLSVWDQAFGTFRRGPTECRAVGLDEPARVPARYRDQLWVPFRWGKE